MRTTTIAVATLSALVLLVTLASAKVYHHETFDSLDAWMESEHQPGYGKIINSAGELFVDEALEKGLQLTEDARFYAISSKLPTPVDNDKKDLVISFSVKNPQLLKCGGTYIKFMSELDQEDFHGESDYWLMFGPDRCGNINRIHIIFNYKGKNLLWNKMVPYPADRLTHVYTLRITPENTFELYIDGVKKAGGHLDKEWSFLEPETIPDPEDSKPEDWVDEATIADPSDKKPDDWDDEPAVIADPDATKPEDWDDEEDGAWDAPEIPNPAYKGEWRPTRIANPAYKGPWAARRIPNPNYEPDDNLYRMPQPIEYMGIDVWQVDGGSIFDNIIIGDNIKEVLALVDKTYGAIKEDEKALLEEHGLLHITDEDMPKTNAQKLRARVDVEIEAEKEAIREERRKAQQEQQEDNSALEREQEHEAEEEEAEEAEEDL